MSDKQTYRVRPGFTFGVGRAKQPGDVVELTDAEAEGFLDKLELVGEEKAPPPGTVEEIKAWLATNPEPGAVEAVLETERAGKNRASAVEALQAYLTQE